MKKNEYTKTCNYPADALKIPESPDLERAVLGALMVFPESVADVRGILTSTAFYDPQNARIYDAICKLDDRGIFPDLYQVFEEGRIFPVSILPSLRRPSDRVSGY